MTILSLEQQYAFQKFCRGDNLFITGAGGSGKSFLIETIVKYLNDTNNKKFQVTSTTGCSSVLLSNNIQINGKNLSVKTISSWSGIRLCKGTNKSVIDSVVKNKYMTKAWREIKILIIDEISMMSCKVFNILDSIAKITRKNIRPFGGIQVILLGDFLQLPPIPDRSDIETSKLCFESEEWYNVIPLVNHIELKTIFRQKDEVFRNILNEIRIGILSQKNKEILQGLVGRKYKPDENNGVIPLQILPTRNQVASINKSQYDDIQGEEYIYTSKLITNSNIYIDNNKILSAEDLLKCKGLSPQILEYEINNLKSNIPVEDSIQLKVGVPVMILVNLDLENSISNGTLAVISSFTKMGDYSVPVVKFSNGKERLMEYYSWQNPDYPSIVISQLPLTLAYASSIHKQQGSSIEMARMNLGYGIFEKAQIYVALSRVTSLDGLYLDSFHAHKISVNEKAIAFYDTFSNITYDEVKNDDNFDKFKFKA
jgi:ATP-dependent DNA helicase PIF1